MRIDVKVLMLADPTSAHTIKWARSLAASGLTIGIFGLTAADSAIYAAYPDIILFSAGFTTMTVRSPLASPAKLKYLRVVPQLNAVIRRFKPDILHAHFATSYGLLGALSGFHPFILSVWGADIFDFPKKSYLHKFLVRYNLKRADKILSTSQVMAVETRKYISTAVEVTPFGIDVTVFKPQPPVQSLFGPNDIVIGTVKALEPKYGVDQLIRAFKLVRDKTKELPLKLLIVGTGSQEQQLTDLVQELGLQSDTVFTGRVSYDQVPVYYNMLTIFAALSTQDSESFGVAVIEASACEKPVVVANVGGLPEVVEDGVTGFVVPPRSPELAAAAFEKLIGDEALRQKMGKQGRERVKRLYNWSDNVAQMIEIYRRVL